MTLRKAPYKRVALNPQERRLWEDTLAALSWIAPGFTHVIYTMLTRSGHNDIALFTHDLKTTAATDGFQLIFDPRRFFKLSLMERCFVVLHEVMHEMLNHVRLGYAFLVNKQIKLGAKSLPYDHEFANIIQDYVINAILIESKLGKYNPDWLYDINIATDKDQWVESYFKWFKQKEAAKAAGGKGRFDDHLEPWESTEVPVEAVPARNEQQWEIVIKQGAEIQASQGNMPASLKMFFDELLRPKVEWTDHIRGLLTRIMGSGAYSWAKLDRRMIVRGIGAPGVTGHGAGLIVVGGDTSGSIFGDPALPQRFISEVGGMIEDVNPEVVHVVWCDAKVQRVDICHDAADVKKMLYDGVPGGGGTHFSPVFDYIEKEGLKPDALIYLTDGYGSFPKHEPDYPVIWGSITDTSYPWGTVVRIPVED